MGGAFTVGEHDDAEGVGVGGDGYAERGKTEREECDEPASARERNPISEALHPP